MRVTKLLLILAVVALASTISVADNTLCSEDGVTGCVIQLPVGGTTMWVASDGEAAFDPFGYGHDTSDGVALDGIWQQSTGSSWVFCPACGIVGAAGLNVWVLPACDANGVCENGPVTELPGRWDAPGYFWNFSGAYSWSIYDANGELSDIITIGNFGPNGDAALFFQSDGPVPEPGTLVMFGTGLIGAAGAIRRKLSL